MLNSSRVEELLVASPGAVASLVWQIGGSEIQSIFG